MRSCRFSRRIISGSGRHQLLKEDAAGEEIHLCIIEKEETSIFNDTVAWLLDAGNAAVQYRTKIELLGLEAEPAEALIWIEKKLPAEWFEPAMERIRTSFDFGCESFMLLQAMVALGFGENPEV